MIHLFSNVYLTYFETKQPEMAAGIVVGGTDRVSNFIESTTTVRIGRYSSYSEVLGKPEDFTDLVTSTFEGQKKIIIYMDEVNFKEFIIKWLKSGYVRADLEKLYQIYRFYGDCELTKTDRIKLFEDGYKKCNAKEKIRQYWNLSKEDFLRSCGNIPKYELPNEVYRTLGYEFLITNALLGSEYYQNKLKDRALELYNKTYPDGKATKEEIYEDIVTGKDELMLFARLYDVQARFNTYLVALAIKTRDGALLFSRGLE
jgi:hypothetical protein